MFRDRIFLNEMVNKTPKKQIRPSYEHIYIYKKIKDKAKLGPYLKPSVILTELKRIVRVPNTLHYPILKQMEEEGLIKRINHQRYEVKGQEKDKRIKEINLKLKELDMVGRRNRMLKAMEECGIIKKSKGTKFRILTSDCDKKIEFMGDYTFW